MNRTKRFNATSQLRSREKATRRNGVDATETFEVSSERRRVPARVLAVEEEAQGRAARRRRQERAVGLVAALLALAHEGLVPLARNGLELVVDRRLPLLPRGDDGREGLRLAAAAPSLRLAVVGPALRRGDEGVDRVAQLLGPAEVLEERADGLDVRRRERLVAAAAAVGPLLQAPRPLRALRRAQRLGHGALGLAQHQRRLERLDDGAPHLRHVAGRRRAVARVLGGAAHGPAGSPPPGGGGGGAARRATTRAAATGSSCTKRHREPRLKKAT